MRHQCCEGSNFDFKCNTAIDACSIASEDALLCATLVRVKLARVPMVALAI